MTEQLQTPDIEVPVEEYIGVLRSEIANLNDERVRLQTQVNFQAKIIAQLQAQVPTEPHTHDADG